MNEPFRKEGTLLKLHTEGIERADRVTPANGESYTEEEAMQEIARCQKCSCDACMRACDLMRLHEKTPRRLYEEVYITIHPGTLSRDGTWGDQTDQHLRSLRALQGSLSAAYRFQPVSA